MEEIMFTHLYPSQATNSTLEVLQTSFYDFIFNDDYKNKVLVRNKYAGPAVILMYVLFAKWIGPAIMKNRKPFNLKNVMIIYNFTQTFFNLVIAYNLVACCIHCWPIHCMTKYNPNLSSYTKGFMRYFWWLLLTKYVDLLDTIFFVLRKKDGHISILHVFHHALMCLLFTKILPTAAFGYYLGLVLSINTMIHVIMYFYYGLAAIGPHMQKYLWWKKYLTEIQIIQFVIGLSYIVTQMLRGCEEIALAECSVAIFMFILLVLFTNFYIKSYNKNK